MFESNFCDFRPNVLNLLTKFTINQPSINMVRQIPAIFKLLSPKCIFYEIEMKQKQNRNALKGGKYKKGNLTKTVNVKKIT